MKKGSIMIIAGIAVSLLGLELIREGFNEYKTEQENTLKADMINKGFHVVSK